MESSSINYNLLIDKAKNGWQLALAKFCTFPVKLLIWIVNIYMGLALLFGFIAIVLFIGGLFDDSKFKPSTIFLLYVPFFVVFSIVAVSPRIQFLKRSGTILLFVFSNLIIYAAPVLYGTYTLRYNYLEDALHRVEKERNYDYYCNELINAYKTRKAFFRVVVDSKIEYNQHVGHSWIFKNYIYSIPIGSQPTIIELSENDTIVLSSLAYEDDVYMDFGRNTEVFKVPWNLLLERTVSLPVKVAVMENRGRFIGGVCLINNDFYIRHYKDDERSRNSSYVLNDSIKKYFFHFHKIYKRQYKEGDRPWSNYMSDEDKREYQKNYQLIIDGNRFRID